MVLFLDFDGVLHEYDASERSLLRHVPLLSNVLRQHMDIDVVIASDWRKSHTLIQLAAYFPNDLHNRFVGVTSEGPARVRQRERECWRWLCDHLRANERWIAIDDNLNNFGPDLPGLGAVLFVDPATGLDAQACSLLQVMIQTAAQGAQFCYERETIRGWPLWT
ncbi:hypothetical protein GTP41_20865 [Pseudoduganella sp. DS3]|uniref:HAD family hydrolase n=1 Tax=Pseudoduganella guangdongensis TaxID=2692179 RepID=A0A6N9HLL6_9BURK|nr:HAD domain-containing protein [Pseudoduganella guangdongensis]MYN04548.1 hypothetical protein [Pseudoduganella guangdongensis]